LGTGLQVSSQIREYDIHPDCKRFLMMIPVEGKMVTTTSGAPRKINIVVNRLEELKERVPAD